MQHRLIWEVGKHVTRLFVDPAVNSLRTRYGVQSRPDTFSDHSDTLNLQLYSQHFATRPPDWTSGKAIRWLLLLRSAQSAARSADEEFLQAGEPPVLCTLGSSAVKAPGTFFTASAAALKGMGLRAIMLLGDEANRPADLPKSVLAVSEAPYYLIMPRVRFVMHQCGIGTLSHTLRAGKASIGFPYAFDQPNNARRLEALKVAEVILPPPAQTKRFNVRIERAMASSADKVANRLGEIFVLKMAWPFPATFLNALSLTFRPRNDAHEIKQILAERNLSPLKQLGQNFLYDQNLANAIALRAIRLWHLRRSWEMQTRWSK